MEECCLTNSRCGGDNQRFQLKQIRISKRIKHACGKVDQSGVLICRLFVLHKDKKVFLSFSLFFFFLMHKSFRQEGFSGLKLKHVSYHIRQIFIVIFTNHSSKILLTTKSALKSSKKRIFLPNNVLLIFEANWVVPIILHTLGSGWVERFHLH